MPQLDTTWFISQFFWLCVCFFIMLFFMSKVFLPKITDILEQRQRKIDDYLVKAHQLKEQAEESLKKYQTALAQASADANSALEESRKEMNAFIAKKNDELNLKLQKKLSEGESKVREMHLKALNEIKDVSQVLAKDILSKLNLPSIDEAELKKNIDDVLKH